MAHFRDCKTPTVPPLLHYTSAETWEVVIINTFVSIEGLLGPNGKCTTQTVRGLAWPESCHGDINIL